MRGAVKPLLTRKSMMHPTCPVDEHNKTVLTFFSEFKVEWQGQPAIECVFLAGILVVAILGNVTILIAIVRSPQLRAVTTNLVIVSLAVSDLLMVAGIPFILVTRVTRHWVFGEVTCKAVVYVQFVCGTCCILNLAFVSVEHYLHVRPTPSGLITRTTVLIILAVSWLLSVAFPVPVALAQTVRTIRCDQKDFIFCGVSWPDGFRTDIYLAIFGVIFFIIPLTVLCVFYTKIFLLVRKSSSATSSSRKPGRTGRIQLRLIKMSVTIVVVFLVMLLPFFVLSFLAVQRASITSTQLTATLILALANTAVNPLIYGYFNTGIRREFKTMYLSRCRQRSASQEYV